MKTRSNMTKGLLLSGLIGLFLLCPLSGAYASIARVTSFTGDVVILSGANTFKLSKLGQTVNTGDKIQTKAGTAQLAFNDGAVLKINPHTTTMVQERMEESGAWMFKSKKMARRITVFVGKLWFKSGVSDRSNYLQSPTAVCGLRGSDGDFGYDNLNTTSTCTAARRPSPAASCSSSSKTPASPRLSETKSTRSCPRPMSRRAPPRPRDRPSTSTRPAWHRWTS